MLSPSSGFLIFLILLTLLLTIEVTPRRIAPQPVKTRRNEVKRRQRR